MMDILVILAENLHFYVSKLRIYSAEIRKEIAFEDRIRRYKIMIFRCESGILEVLRQFFYILYFILNQK